MRSGPKIRLASQPQHPQRQTRRLPATPLRTREQAPQAAGVAVSSVGVNRQYVVVVLAPVGDRPSILAPVVRLTCVRHLRTHFPTCKAHFEAPRAERHVPFYVFSLAPFMYCALCLSQFPRTPFVGNWVAENL